MSIMVVVGRGGKAAGFARRKPIRALRGRRRKAVQKLLHYLIVVSTQDTAESLRAEDLGYTPYLFRASNDSAISQAQTQLISRCRNVLAAKV